MPGRGCMSGLGAQKGEQDQEGDHRDGPGCSLGGCDVRGTREDRGLVPGLRGTGGQGLGGHQWRESTGLEVPSPSPTSPGETCRTWGSWGVGPLGFIQVAFRSHPVCAGEPPEPERNTEPQRVSCASRGTSPVSAPKGCRVLGAGMAAQASAPHPAHGPAVLVLPLPPPPKSQHSPREWGSMGMASTPPPSREPGVQACGLRGSQSDLRDGPQAEHCGGGSRGPLQTRASPLHVPEKPEGTPFPTLHSG